MTKMIIKASGEKEVFSKEKFQRSLRKSGASKDIIERLTSEVMKDPSLKSTKDIYRYAFNQLSKTQPAIAARYNLKAALSKLGPQGYSFEKFVAEIFIEQGFKTELGYIMEGFCVSHEIDVLLREDNTLYLVECKFHASHLKVNVKVPLYIRARFEDIEKRLVKNKKVPGTLKPWIFTNTKFTSEAVAYGQCVGIKLTSWSYPEKESLAYLIDTLGLHPITALATLNKKQKLALLTEGVVLCRDIEKNRSVLRKLGLSDKKIAQLIDDAHTICSLGAIS
jgi:hypothetical protein